jgi:hypothetical protein
MTSRRIDIGGMIRKYNDGVPISINSNYHQSRTLSKKIKRVVESMIFEYSVEPDSIFNHHHIHFYLNVPAVSREATYNVLLKFIGADRFTEKTEGYTPLKTLDKVYHATTGDGAPAMYGQLEITNIYDINGWRNYISKGEITNQTRQIEWK